LNFTYDMSISPMFFKFGFKIYKIYSAGVSIFI
jgi:hypothetical protein